MGDKTRGLYRKFTVTRTDGSSAKGGKHDGCNYFVLDVTHDKHADAALLAYAASCEAEYPLLAQDVRDLARQPLPATAAVPSSPAQVAVAGRMERSIAAFVNACDVHLADEQERPAPDNALIAVLCDAIRLAREYVELAASRTNLALPPSSPAQETKYCTCLSISRDPLCVFHGDVDKVAALPPSSVAQETK